MITRFPVIAGVLLSQLIMASPSVAGEHDEMCRNFLRSALPVLGVKFVSCQANMVSDKKAELFISLTDALSVERWYIDGYVEIMSNGKARTVWENWNTPIKPKDATTN